ncbi:MAG: hypothetical protein H6R10_3500 [Rhodocyclaceae bacterium]|nr:hypothetical protein [Rhodocyclaceae bacterium]
MGRLATIAGAVVVLAAAGCSDIEHSRTLGNPDVPARTLAQQVCSNCHGIDGNSTSPNFPRLAGQPEEYLRIQLTGFRSHGRSDPAGFEYMWGLSHHLTDGQIEGLASYFAAQAPTRNPDPPAGTPEQIRIGSDIFSHGVPGRNIPPCSGCHGDHGQGKGLFPRLAGQHADYLVKQLTVFQQTHQRPAGVAMSAVTHELTRENMKNVAAFLQAQ